MADFRTEYHGTIRTITPLTNRCRHWIEENVAYEPWQWFGQRVAVEPRYLPTLVEEMLDAGLIEEGIGE